MKRLLIFAAFLAMSVPTFAVGHTYYIDKTLGDDTRTSTQAQSKTTPWAHLPGMPTCASACAAYTPVADDVFVLKGGETWAPTDLGVNWTWSGTSGHPITITVDATWYSGASWTRPIFTCGGVGCSSDAGGSWATLNAYAADYIVIDNIEFTGFWLPANSTHNVIGIQTVGLSVEIKNCYFHGWAHGSPIGKSTFLITTYTANGTSFAYGSKIHDNVIDGSDTAMDDGVAIQNGESVYNNVMRYVYNGFNGLSDNLYGNLIEHVDFTAATGAHCNPIYHKGPFNTTALTMRLYNNVIRDSSAGGCVAFYMMAEGAGGNCPTCVTYVYNNVIYNLPSMDSPLMATGEQPCTGAGCGGTFYIYNNTVEAGTASCMGNLLVSASDRTAHYADNHCVTNGGSVCASGGIVTCTDDGGNLSQTAAQAATHYNNAAAAFAYSPKDASAEGIAFGLAGNSATWTTFAAAAGTASLSDTDFACTDISNVSTCPARTVILRPANATKIDAGAYMYSGAVTAPTCTLVAAPLVIKIGTSSTLTFAVANTPTVCSIDNGIGNVSCSGATPSVSPTTATTYTATVTNAGGTNTCTATVSIGGVATGANTIRTANTVIQ